eukprot:7120594-Pyramimonas_sp.AAC.1
MSHRLRQEAQPRRRGHGEPVRVVVEPQGVRAARLEPRPELARADGEYPLRLLRGRAPRRGVVPEGQGGRAPGRGR